MGRPSHRNERCRRHPEHRQSMGVCPYCLRHRLANLKASSTSYASSTASSSAYSSDNSDVSSAASTPSYHHRGTGTGAGRLSLFGCIISDSRAFRKQETAAKSGPLPLLVVGDDHQEKGNKKKKGRFWSKLLGGSRRLRGKDGHGGALLHSNTVKEKDSAHYFSFP